MHRAAHEPFEPTRPAILLFRVDASPAIGTGHLMRCMALAEMAAEYGVGALFAVAECPPALAARLNDGGMALHRLHDGADTAEWVALIAGTAPQAVVIDGYGFDSGYRKATAAAGRPVLAIDDATSDAPLHADMVLNSSPTATADHYVSTPGCRLFLGPAYALLRHEFRHGANNRTHDAFAGRLLLTLGGSDPLGLTVALAARLDAALPGGTPIDVVIGGAASADAEAEDLAHHPSGNVTVHHDVRDMAALMHTARIAVSAAGSTLWELARLRVPSVALVVADNQVAVLRPPINGWFEAFDARRDAHGAVRQAVAAVQSLWHDPAQRARSATALGGIGVATRTAEIFDAIIQRQ